MEDAALRSKRFVPGRSGYLLIAGQPGEKDPAKTVQQHLSRILAKFRARDRVDLIFKVLGLETSSPNTGRGDR